MSTKTIKTGNLYYNFMDDYNDFPQAWIYIVMSHRGPGKTYSSLLSCMRDDRKFCYLKRTNDDLDLICSEGSGKVELDLSPFCPINRDHGTNIRPFKVKNGLGYFAPARYNDDKQRQEADGDMIGYLLSLNSIHKFKGFDMSECDWLIFDEFVPSITERVNKKEGDAVMELYKTIERDRIKRGKDPLKLICFANTTNIMCPLLDTLDIVDDISEMNTKDIHWKYIEDRGIFIHVLDADKYRSADEEDSMMYRSMVSTRWGRMAFGGEFSYNDFSKVRPMSIKGMSPLCSLIYKGKTIYIWHNEDVIYITDKSRHGGQIFNLDIETERSYFWGEYGIDIYDLLMQNRVYFNKYTYYYLIFNFNKIF